MKKNLRETERQRVRLERETEAKCVRQQRETETEGKCVGETK